MRENGVTLTSPDQLPGLLRQLDDHWINLGVPLAKRAAPGLSDQEIDDLLAPTGIELPEELRVWWRWHNGMTDPDVRDLDATVCASSWRLQPLQHSVEDYKVWVDTDAEHPSARPEWFPFCVRADAERLMCDTGRADGRTGTIIAWDCLHFIDEQWVIADSLTELVRMWVQRLDAGLVTACPADNNHEWQFDYVEGDLITKYRFG